MAIALSEASFEEAVSPSKRNLYNELAPRFLASLCPEEQKNRLGWWTVEPLKALCGIVPKVYCTIKDDGEEQAKSKGIPLRQNESLLRYESYKAFVLDPEGVAPQRAVNRGITNRYQQTATTISYQKALTGYIKVTIGLGCVCNHHFRNMRCMIV